MVEIYLYGGLRRYAPGARRDRDSVVQVAPRPGETVRTTLEQLGIQSQEVFHIFLNGALLATGNSMAPWLGHQGAVTCASDRSQALDTPLKSGDRVGLFARDMALLVV
jgi:molybdopterin converting factor small subunit